MGNVAEQVVIEGTGGQVLTPRQVGVLEAVGVAAELLGGQGAGEKALGLAGYRRSRTRSIPRSSRGRGDSSTSARVRTSL